MAQPGSRSETKAASLVTQALRTLILRIPASSQTPASDPRSRSQRLATTAARKASAISAGLALPSGPVGLLTILPDLAAIWTVQSQLVSDIAAVHGRSAALNRASLVYCLFKHGGAALVRDLVVRAGERLVVRNVSLRLLQATLTKVGVRVSERVVGQALSRFIPILGALGVGAYAYYDTSKVAANAIELFASDPFLEEAHPSGGTPPRAPRTAATGPSGTPPRA